MKIDFLIDHINRDIPLGIYIKLCYDLANLESEVEIKKIGSTIRETGYDYFDLRSSKKDLIVTPSYNVKRTPAILSYCLRQNAKLVVYHAEQIFAKPVYKEKFNMNYTESYNRHVMGHLVWGEQFAKDLIKYSNVDPKKIYITGNPKMDIARRKLENKKRLNDKIKNVLFISNFVLGDLSDKQWKNYKRKYNIETKTSLNQFMKNARKLFIDWIKEAATIDESISCIVRLHPSEKKEPYKDLFKYDNVIFSSNSDLAQDILEADMIFSYTSTAIFEYILSGKPYFNMNLGLKYPNDFCQDYFKLFKWINKNEFMDIFRDRYYRNTIIEETRKDYNMSTLNGFMYKPSGRSLLRTAIAIIELGSKANMSKIELSPAELLKMKLYPTIPLLKNIYIKTGYLLRKKFGINNYISKYTDKKIKERKDKREFYTNEILLEQIPRMRDLIHKEDIEIIENRNYQIRETDHGNYIDFLGAENESF